MQISGAVANNGAQGISFGGSGSNAMVTGAISGPGSVNVAGAGKWTLTGANTYSGPTTVTGGTLLVDNAAGSGTGTGTVTVSPGATLLVGNNDANGSISGNIINNGAMNFVRSDSLLNYGGVISGTGSVLIAGSGTVTLSGAPPTPTRPQALACLSPRAVSSTSTSTRRCPISGTAAAREAP
jgi:autotransporter-associated beta strand protein/adhesin HecA-like repeat protein